MIPAPIMIAGIMMFWDSAAAPPRIAIRNPTPSRIVDIVVLLPQIGVQPIRLNVVSPSCGHLDRRPDRKPPLAQCVPHEFG